jgi:hypothetical protein
MIMLGVLILFAWRRAKKSHFGDITRPVLSLKAKASCSLNAAGSLTFESSRQT